MWRRRSGSHHPTYSLVPHLLLTAAAYRHSPAASAATYEASPPHGRRPGRHTLPSVHHSSFLKLPYSLHEATYTRYLPGDTEEFLTTTAFRHFLSQPFVHRSARSEPPATGLPSPSGDPDAATITFSRIIRHRTNGDSMKLLTISEKLTESNKGTSVRSSEYTR